MKAKFKKPAKGIFSTRKNYETGRTETVCSYNIELGHLANDYPGLKRHYSATGFSTYNPLDEYDEELGQRIAESRAKKNVYRQAIDILKKELVKEKSKVDELTAAIKRHEILLDKERQHSQDLLNS